MRILLGVRSEYRVAEQIVNSLLITLPKSMLDVVTPRSAFTGTSDPNNPPPPVYTSCIAVPLKVALPPALPSLGQLFAVHMVVPCQPPLRKWATAPAGRLLDTAPVRVSRLSSSRGTVPNAEARTAAARTKSLWSIRP